jgi:hypothetical protein
MLGYCAISQETPNAQLLNHLYILNWFSLSGDQERCARDINSLPTNLLYRAFHFEVSISAPQLDLRSKSQQILTLARARLIWDFQSLGAKARVMPIDFSEALDVKSVL